MPSPNNPSPSGREHPTIPGVRIEEGTVYYSDGQQVAEAIRQEYIVATRCAENPIFALQEPDAIRSRELFAQLILQFENLTPKWRNSSSEQKQNLPELVALTETFHEIIQHLNLLSIPPSADTRGLLRRPSVAEMNDVLGRLQTMLPTVDECSGTQEKLDRTFRSLVVKTEKEERREDRLILEVVAQAYMLRCIDPFVDIGRFCRFQRLSKPLQKLPRQDQHGGPSSISARLEDFFRAAMTLNHNEDRSEATILRRNGRLPGLIPICAIKELTEAFQELDPQKLPGHTRYFRQLGRREEVLSNNILDGRKQPTPLYDNTHLYISDLINSRTFVRVEPGVILERIEDFYNSFRGAPSRGDEKVRLHQIPDFLRSFVTQIHPPIETWRSLEATFIYLFQGTSRAESDLMKLVFDIWSGPFGIDPELGAFVQDVGLFEPLSAEAALQRAGMDYFTELQSLNSDRNLVDPELKQRAVLEQLKNEGPGSRVTYAGDGSLTYLYCIDNALVEKSNRARIETIRAVQGLIDLYAKPGPGETGENIFRRDIRSYVNSSGDRVELSEARWKLFELHSGLKDRFITTGLRAFAIPAIEIGGIRDVSARGPLGTTSDQTQGPSLSYIENLVKMAKFQDAQGVTFPGSDLFKLSPATGEELNSLIASDPFLTALNEKLRSQGRKFRITDDHVVKCERLRLVVGIIDSSRITAGFAWNELFSQLRSKCDVSVRSLSKHQVFVVDFDPQQDRQRGSWIIRKSIFVNSQTEESLASFIRDCARRQNRAAEKGVSFESLVEQADRLLKLYNEEGENLGSASIEAMFRLLNIAHPGIYSEYYGERSHQYLSSILTLFGYSPHSQAHPNLGSMLGFSSEEDKDRVMACTSAPRAVDDTHELHPEIVGAAVKRRLSLEDRSARHPIDFGIYVTSKQAGVVFRVVNEDFARCLVYPGSTGENLGAQSVKPILVQLTPAEIESDGRANTNIYYYSALDMSRRASRLSEEESREPFDFFGRSNNRVAQTLRNLTFIFMNRPTGDFSWSSRTVKVFDGVRRWLHSTLPK